MNNVQVGDTIRILEDGACSADVLAGDVFTVKTVLSREIGRIETNDCPPGYGGWRFHEEHYEIIARANDPRPTLTGDVPLYG